MFRRRGFSRASRRATKLTGRWASTCSGKTSGRLFAFRVLHPDAKGVYENQPSSHAVEEAKSIWLTFAFFLLALVVLMIGFRSVGPKRRGVHRLLQVRFESARRSLVRNGQLRGKGTHLERRVEDQHRSE